ncbi:MAG TPA: VOC family protein [Thermoanaerobaculia bacterium]|nr:VOC family protein [Thermoanaerobaculia bacterium]
MTTKRKAEASPGSAIAAGASAPRWPQRRRPETLRLRSLTPSFTVSDLELSVAFYTGTLGCIVAERWTRDGAPVGVMLRAGSCELRLIQDDWAKGRDRRKGEGVRIYCETEQDIDALAERARAAGGTIVSGPQDHSWGARGVSLDDPDGFHLTIYRRFRGGT